MPSASGVPLIRWIGSHGREERIPLDSDEVRIGRKADSDLVLSSPFVSRRHARIIREAGSYWLEDENSTHGTFVNDEPIQRRLLENGDKIRLGRDPTELLFLSDESSGTPHSQSTDTAPSISELSVYLSPGAAQQTELEKISYILDFQYQWGKAFSSQRMFQEVLRAALKLSGAQRGFILLRRQHDFEYVVGLDQDGKSLSESEFQPSRSVTGQVMETGSAIYMTGGISDDLAVQESIVALNLRAVACLPLTWIIPGSESPEVHGILYLDSTRLMHTLSGLDEKILNRLAVEAANIFEKLEMIRSFEEKARVEREMELARETQRNLLPQSVPQFENFSIRAYSQPTRYVGGDFYDFLTLPSGEWMGMLADVSGKGISAALLSALFQGAIEMECRANSNLEEVLSRVNQLLCERSSANRFVTLMLFALDRDGHGRFVNAGHNPSYILRRSEQRVEELASQDLILGAFEAAVYHSHPFRLHLGDVLLVYSDGLTEAENPDGQMLGTEALIELLRESSGKGADHLQQTILDTIEEFTQKRAQTDDITFLIVERLAPMETTPVEYSGHPQG